ncbi:hypothetical protein [Bacillus wiedmannii]|uniref:hypothetical protein n=1 Tax=Bacillus wiedmannii TaxID=1890302 RepID=UPI003D963F25
MKVQEITIGKRKAFLLLDSEGVLFVLILSFGLQLLFVLRLGQKSKRAEKICLLQKYTE